MLLVLAATVLGSWVVASSDDTVGFWSVRGDVAEGDPVRRADLVEARARVPDSVAGRLLRTDEELPATLEDLVWSRGVGSGALLERSALTRRGALGATELPLAVTTGAAPADLARGHVVDVWVGPGPGDDVRQESARVLEGVRVLSTGAGSQAAGGALARTVVVDVDGVDLTPEAVSRVSAGHVTLVRQS